MFGIGLPELLIILVVALIVVGPRKLPDLAKSLGKGMREFRKATDEIKGEFQEYETYKDLQEVKSTITEAVDNLKPDLDLEPVKEIKELGTSIKDTVDSLNPKKILDEVNPLEPKQPKENLEGRLAVLDDISQEQESAAQRSSQPPPAADAGPAGQDKPVAKPEPGTTSEKQG